MLLNLRRAFVACAIFILVLGLAYPAAETAVGQVLFRHGANGSLTAQGSTLIGQRWDGPRWFHGRPDGFDPSATGGSNLGPRSRELVETYRTRKAALEKDGVTPTPDLLAASGSGLDPDITPEGAYAQVESVATARGLAPSRVRALVAGHVQGPQWGFLGASRVNVLTLNKALDALS